MAERLSPSFALSEQQKPVKSQPLDRFLSGSVEQNSLEAPEGWRQLALQPFKLRSALKCILRRRASDVSFILFIY